MSNRLVVLLAMLLAIGSLADRPAVAGDRVALVGCDLLSQGGPRVDYLQLGAPEGRNVSIGRFESNPVGRDCAQVLAQVQDAGFRFHEFRVYGGERSRGLWFWKSR